LGGGVDILVIFILEWENGYNVKESNVKQLL